MEPTMDKAKRERMKCQKKNALLKIRYYEKHGPKSYGKERQMEDIWARMRYEYDKLLIKAIDEDLELYEKLMEWGNNCYNKIPKIRLTAVIIASNGQKMRATELTDEEMVIARKIANEKVDEWLNDFKTEIAS